MFRSNTFWACLILASLGAVLVAGDLPSCTRARCSHCDTDLIQRLCPSACAACVSSSVHSKQSQTPVIAAHGQPNAQLAPQPQSLQTLPQAPVNGNNQPQLIPTQPETPYTPPAPPPPPAQQQNGQPQPGQYYQQPQFPGFQQPQQPQFPGFQQPQQPQFPGFQQPQPFAPLAQTPSPFFNPFNPFLPQGFQGQQQPFNPFTFPTFAPATFAPVTPAPPPVTLPPHPAQPQPQPQPQQPQVQYPQAGGGSYAPSAVAPPPQNGQGQAPQVQVSGGNSQAASGHVAQPNHQRGHVAGNQHHRSDSSRPKQIYHTQKPQGQQGGQQQHVQQPQPQPQTQTVSQTTYPQQPQPQPQPLPVPVPAQIIQPYPAAPAPVPLTSNSIDPLAAAAAGGAAVRETCPRANWEPCVSKELANERFRNCCQHLGEGCQQLCSYDQTLTTIQLSVLTGRCPISKVADMMICASGYEDATPCCAAYNVFEPGFEQCRPYCNPSAGLPNDGMLAEKYRCLSKLNQIQRCFYVTQRP
uniref:DB domain-containing protein n=1 Tax=Panagrellus redivivus TaxID=6233 RepID=A0A7E4VC50_PANRE